MPCRPTDAPRRYARQMKSVRSDVGRLWLTLDRRFWIVAAAGTIASLVALGIPTAVIPNPLFSRMTPTDPANIAAWLTSAPLIGLIVASYLAKPGTDGDPHEGGHEWSASIGGIGSFLAIGCPVCNKIVVGFPGSQRGSERLRASPADHRHHLRRPARCDDGVAPQAKSARLRAL